MGTTNRPARREWRRDVPASPLHVLRRAMSGDERAETDEALGEEASVNARLLWLYEERDRVARILQRSLVPSALPEIPGVDLAHRYRPAGAGAEAGGDLYDAFAVAGGAWMIGVGDVCGKGPEAAAVMGLVRHTLRAVARFVARPAALARELNAAVSEEMPDGCFCSLCLVRVSPRPDRVELRVASAGHPLPFVLRRRGGVERVGRPGLVLGVLPDAVVHEDRATLFPGDAAVLFTDGVVEQRGLDIDAGEERLAALLRECGGASAEAIAARIDDELLVTHRAPDDDMAVVVLRAA